MTEFQEVSDVTPGLYLFTDDQSREHLVSVCKTKGPKFDGNGPLFAETFRANFSSPYFYRAITELRGTWRRIVTNAKGMPIDQAIVDRLDECVKAGFAHKNP